jgi:hypothetical protein
VTLIEPIKITGLAEFNRNLRRLDSDLPKVLRQAQNKAAQLVVDWAQPRVPSRSGKARRSLRASSTRTETRITGGGARVPYYPWLDFGGRVGRKRSIHRAYLSGGRYIFAGYAARRDEVSQALVEALIEVADQAGVVIDRE